jgi:hypothetical protein
MDACPHLLRIYRRHFARILNRERVKQCLFVDLPRSCMVLYL